MLNLVQVIYYKDKKVGINMIKNMECINLCSKDHVGLFKFYNEKLGIPVQFEGFGNHDGAKLGFGRYDMGITIWDENKWGSTASGQINLVFYCENLDTEYQDLKNRGVDLEPPVKMEWGSELVVKDPLGNTITLMEQHY